MKKQKSFTQNEKYWIIFLSFLLFKMERMKKTPKKIWGYLVPKIIELWEEGEFYHKYPDELYLYSDQSNPILNSAFERVFGEELLRKYCSEIIGHSHVSVKLEPENGNNFSSGGVLMKIEDDGKITKFHEGSFPYYCRDCKGECDNEFLKYFEEHIGINFEKVEYFSKLS